jgi:hypothetical protein
MTMNTSRPIACSVLAGLAIAAPAFAQWTEEDAAYLIHRIGLYEPANTSPTGRQSSSALVQNSMGWAAGLSTRYTPDGATNGDDAWIFDGEGTHQLGLIGGVHTTATGLQESRPEFITQNGQVAGVSYRYNAAGQWFGDSVWVYNGVSTIEVGFTGGVYTRADGYQHSDLRRFNNSGQAAGTTDRNGPGVSSLGKDAWLWTGSTLRQIGFTSAAYTGLSGTLESAVTALSDTGKVLGTSERYYTGTDINAGKDVWIVSGTTTQRVGFVGAGYETDQGFRFSFATLLNSSGNAAGYSGRYTGNQNFGQDAWLYDGAATRLVGFTGPNYVSTSGTRSSSVSSINEAGQVAGTSARFAGSVGVGKDAWISDGFTTRQIGLTGGVYTASTGRQESEPWVLTPGGRVAGISRRYSSTDTENGYDAWVFNGTTTRQVGLTGGVYTGTGGYQRTELRSLIDSVKAAGVSQRFSGAASTNGQNAWYWTGVSTRLIGLSDALHTGADGSQFSYVVQQNASGHVVGYSTRYGADGAVNGLTSWYYDPSTNTTTPIVGAVRLADQFSYTRVDLLTEDGFALGTYAAFSAPDDIGQERAFIFHPDRGITDLGSLVSGGLANNGWSTLKSVRHFGDNASVVGLGYVQGQTNGSSAFAMTLPDCPECAADYDRDGGVTGSDIGAFFADFETGDSCADVDQDGGVTGADLGAFFALYEAGGC